MTEIQIAWLELMTVGGLGVILVLLGVTFNIIVKDRINCVQSRQTVLLNNMGFREMEGCMKLKEVMTSMDYEKLYKAYYLQVYSYTISLAKIVR